MGLLILLGVIVGGAIVFLVVFKMMSDSRRRPVIPMVRIAFATGDPELQIWVQRLNAAGIGCRVEDYSGSTPCRTCIGRNSG